MTHFDSWPERFRRLLCRLFGCLVVKNSLGHPVVGEFLVCKRCGKYRSR